jgi:hypothetical protein
VPARTAHIGRPAKSAPEDELEEPVDQLVADPVAHLACARCAAWPHLSPAVGVSLGAGAWLHVSLSPDMSTWGHE